MMANSKRHPEFFRHGVNNVCKQLKSRIVSRVSCLGPWGRQSFPAPLKVEQTVSHRQERKQKATDERKNVRKPHPHVLQAQ